MSRPAASQPADTARSAAALGGPWSDGDGLALADVIARLRRAMRRAARLRDPASALSVAQLELLSCVGENPGVRPSRVARLLRLAPNSVTTLVNGLESRGLVRRAGAAPDRRAVALTLTETGERAVRQWQATNLAILEGALQQLDPGRQQQLADAMPALLALVEAIDAHADQPPSEPGAQ